MPGTPVNEIVKGYVEEVFTYIPSLKKGTEALKAEPEDRGALEELHRLVHTIQGASRMVGMPGLSCMAGQMESALAEALDGSFHLTPEALHVMDGTVDRFQSYCEQLVADGVPSQEKARETIREYRRLRGLPPEEDEAAEAPLLAEIPEMEGGIHDAPDEMDEAGFSDEELRELMAQEGEEAAPEESPEAASEPESDFQEMPDVLPELLESFYEESREHLEDLDGDLNRLESLVADVTPMSPDLKEIIRRIRRAVHTLKGAAAVIGLSNISAWGHIMEDFLDWLFDIAGEIEPETVALLMDSGDLLARIVAIPQDPQKNRVADLKARYGEIMKQAPGEADGTPPSAPAAGPADEAPPGPKILKVPEEMVGDVYTRHQTLRVDTDRVDELVNLIGELMIAASAFDQQMTDFQESVRELEGARDHLREIAREMEVGFEVKALGSLNSALKRMPKPGNSPVPPPADAPAGTLSDFEDFDSLELDQYSQLSLIIRTLNEMSIDFGTVFTRMTHVNSEFDGHMNRQRVLLSELQDKMMQIRMLPMSTLSNKLRRTVREVSKMLRKKIRLAISGEEIELDRLVWEKITDPLMHLLRNAADHGIETPEARKEKGKPPVATITLAAAREGNQVVIRISDDGAGLNYPSIRKKARKAGLIGRQDSLSDEELASLIFKPGFSTQDNISEVSGRGVGMDVVRENIQQLKGTVRVASWSGKGTRFTIRIPLTLAAVRALLFSAGGRTYAIALNEIREIIRADSASLIQNPGRALRIEEEILPIVRISEYLPPGPAETEPSENPIVLIVESGGEREAIEIDALIAQKEIVIKSTGSHLRHVKGISGVTIVGDGNVIPILNIPELIGIQTDRSQRGVLKGPEIETAPDEDAPLMIMIVDDSVSIRQVVSRLMEDQGWRVQPAKDGMDAIDKLRAKRPDLIVLDIEMPRMNGYEFLSAIGAEPDYRDIPVVMLTSRATSKHQDKAVALGANAFMVKPYNDNDFIDLVLKLAG